ncbi:MAG: CO dehydrogenase/CO-methylating acetyl-CoA synthase complex subunit beta [Thermoproteota archaeon]|nr:MAG: CO dehydrogenase/CO-methylating acetyl-CoA synthase complex subunit beta [Candidatus Korarchaeota archaeon]
MFEDIPVDVGVIYEGERIRKAQMYVELGGPKVDYKFELVRARSMDEIEDGKITIIGPDLNELEEGGRYPFGIYIEVAGKQIEEELEGVIERRIHEYTNYIEGVMHLNQRYDIWIRVSKNSYKKGLTSFKIIGKVLERLFKSELPIIEKMQITFITDPKEVEKRYKEALEVYEARDARARGLKDEEVDMFYGCSLCQSFAPTHVCIITPQRYSNCGAISWFDARAAARVDPKGPLFPVEKGECLDPIKGEYTGANEAVKKKSLGAIKRVWLYTAFGYPHTSCGCFEAAAFYIPEVDGFGIVHRGFRGETVNGLKFTTIADSTAGGRQVDGFHGISIEYMRSPKFLQADGGWERVVWVPSEVLERVKDFVPPHLIGKIATEKDVTNIEELKEFLKERNHPVVERWKKMEEIAVGAAEGAPEVGELIEMPVGAGGFRIRLENVRIVAKKAIVRKVSRHGKGEKS